MRKVMERRGGNEVRSSFDFLMNAEKGRTSGFKYYQDENLAGLPDNEWHSPKKKARH
jgi:hypothetical protein